MNNSNKVGYAIHLAERTIVICTNCHLKEKNSPQKLPKGKSISHDEIMPYKQNCHMCGKNMVLGMTDCWSELYPATTDITI